MYQIIVEDFFNSSFIFSSPCTYQFIVLILFRSPKKIRAEASLVVSSQHPSTTTIVLHAALGAGSHIYVVTLPPVANQGGGVVTGVHCLVGHDILVKSVVCTAWSSAIYRYTSLVLITCICHASLVLITCICHASLDIQYFQIFFQIY